MHKQLCLLTCPVLPLVDEYSGHDLHVTEPELGLYWSCGQFKQDSDEFAPEADEYVPWRQRIHELTFTPPDKRE